MTTWTLMFNNQEAEYFRILLIQFSWNTCKVGVHQLLFRISFAIKIFDQKSFIIYKDLSKSKSLIHKRKSDYIRHRKWLLYWQWSNIVKTVQERKRIVYLAKAIFKCTGHGQTFNNMQEFRVYCSLQSLLEESSTE